MASSPSDRVFRQVHRLFSVGAVGPLPDAELLDRFVSRRDAVAEAAFEELVVRHGPMVLRVCRNLLHDAHDAEDAFQAVFIVLANRAGSIRWKGSLASWLFGVAHRVAGRARRGDARRRALDRHVAGRTPESCLPAEDDPDADILHEEIDRLPERLRAPVVLCYLEGLTYAEAAHRLGLSSVVIQGRLARARERLRPRLVRRGVTVPLGLLAAGAAVQAQAAVPLTLIQRTIRIATGFLAGDAAAVLARGVLNSMMLNQLKFATILLCLVIGASYGTWRALGGQAVEQGRPEPGKVAQAPAPAPKSGPAPPPAAFGLTGSVRLEGTGEPVAGATVDVLIADVGRESGDNIRTALSGADGRYTVEIPRGSARAWTLIAPAGYWVPRDSWGIEEFAVSRDEPFHRKDYLVRRGTIWDFRITRAREAKPFPGVVWASGQGNSFRSAPGDAGRVRLTLPTEEGRVTATARESLAADNPVPMTLEWKSGFRPDAVASLENLGGSPARYLFKDRAGKTATLATTEKGRTEPRLEGGRLIVEVTLPEPDPGAYGDLTGKVVEPSGQPVAGARVALIWYGEQGGSMMGVWDGHRATTDARGNYRLTRIPRPDSQGKPDKIALAVTKEGLAGIDTRPFPYQPRAGEAAQVAPTVTLAPGVAVGGTVIDPDGKPLAGAWVQPGGSYASRSRFTRTDDAGRFTVRDLPRGVVRLRWDYGKLMMVGQYLALRDTDISTIKLHPTPEPEPFRARLQAANAARDRIRPLAPGTPAPEWETGGWSDGRPRKLADYRGRVVVLDFCGGDSCAPFMELSSLETLRVRFERQGVAFLVVHSPGDSEKIIRDALEMQKASLPFAMDRDRKRDEIFDPSGMTAERYGVRRYPTHVVIDRKGNVALHSGGMNAEEGVAAMRALARQMGLNVEQSRLNEAEAQRLWEAFLGREIEKILERH